MRVFIQVSAAPSVSSSSSSSSSSPPMASSSTAPAWVLNKARYVTNVPLNVLLSILFIHVSSASVCPSSVDIDDRSPFSSASVEHTLASDPPASSVRFHPVVFAHLLFVLVFGGVLPFEWLLFISCVCNGFVLSVLPTHRLIRFSLVHFVVPIMQPRKRKAQSLASSAPSFTSSSSSSILPNPLVPPSASVTDFKEVEEPANKKVRTLHQVTMYNHAHVCPSFCVYCTHRLQPLSFLSRPRPSTTATPTSPPAPLPPPPA